MSQTVLNERILSGSVAIITGAGQGIGEAIAHKFAEAGAAIAVVDLAGGKAAEVASALVNQGHRSIALQADVSSEHEVADMIRAVLHEFGKIDILVNNAGIGHAKPFL